MSITYPDKINTQFPDAIDNFDRMIDVTTSMLPYIKQYQSYYNAGNLVAANQILVDHPELKQTLISADNMNKLYDAINAIEQFYMADVQQYLINIIKPEGEWSSTKKYAKFNLVQYTTNGAIQSYLCISTNCPIGTLPTDTNYWTPITIQGEQGASGTGLSPRGYWNELDTYYENDLVFLDNVWWVAVKENTNQRPNESSAYWIIVFDGTEGIVPDGVTYIDFSEAEETGELIPIDADTLNGYNAEYFATKSTIVNTTLLSNNWVGTEAPYTNTLAIDRVTETNIIEIVTPPNITAEQVEAFQLAQILNGTQTVGSITLNAWGEKPEADLNIIVIIRGD